MGTHIRILLTMVFLRRKSKGDVANLALRKKGICSVG